MTSDDRRTPWQRQRDQAEGRTAQPGAWGPFHRHFANDAVHRDGGPECDQPGTPRRVYVFDPEYLDAHERAVARYAIAHPREFLCGDCDGGLVEASGCTCGVPGEFLHETGCGRKPCPAGCWDILYPAPEMPSYPG